MDRQYAGKRGFSLVEMAIALGILAFAVFAIYGLLPVGFNLSRQARGDLRGAEITALVAEDFRIWEKMTNGLVTTPFYGLPTGFNTASNSFTTSEQNTQIIYQDGSTNNATGERFVVAVSCDPISMGRASQVNISIIRGAGAKATFVPKGASYTNEEGATFTSLILEPPEP